MKKYFSLIVGALLFYSCDDGRETHVVKQQDIVEAVYSSIIIEPQEMYVVNASVGGYVEEIPVNVGDEVMIDDVLIRIRDVQSSASASNARLSYDIAQQNYKGDLSLLHDLELEIENTALKRANDSLNFDRNKRLFDKKLITAVELEQSELLFTSSKNAHISLVKRLERTKKELKSSLQQAKNNVASMQSRSSDSEIRNKINGIVYDLMYKQGEYVIMQQPVAIVGSKDKFTIKMLIDEVDITKIELGQKVIVRLEAYRGKSFEGKVTHISPRMDSRTQTFEIEAEFTEAPKKLYLGLSGEGNIVVAERKNVLVIPREYLIDGKQVETAEGLVDVEIGIKSLSHVEIVKGLNDGQTIYKPQ